LNRSHRTLAAVALLIALVAVAGCKTKESSVPSAATAPVVATSTATDNSLPPGLPAVAGKVETAFSLRYQDIKIGEGADAEPNKMYKVLYTGWLAADGHKFDSTDDHPRAPALDKDGKPVLDADGKPKQGDPQPIGFPLGFGRVIPGWDLGFGGMKIGGKRRLFIPWQLAYGARGRPGPDAAHPGIPPKADLIFDIELVDVVDIAMPANHPGMGMMPGGHPVGATNQVRPGVTATPNAAPAQPVAPATPAQPQAK
jgi:peptidylprolyl isomerase